MPAAERRRPAAHGHESEVQSGCQVHHAREDVRVAREIDGVLALDDEAEGRRRGAEREAPPVVIGVDGPDRRPSEGRRLSHVELGHLVEAVRAQESTGAGRDDHPDLLPKEAQRRQVEMVVVEMRDQDRIDAVEVVVDELGSPPDRTDSRPQDRVGEQPHAGGLEDDRRMAEPPEPSHPGDGSECRDQVRWPDQMAE